MKVRSALRKICSACFIVRRGRKVFVLCKKNAKHKQRQGYHTCSSSSPAPLPSLEYSGPLGIGSSSTSTGSVRIGSSKSMLGPLYGKGLDIPWVSAAAGAGGRRHFGSVRGGGAATVAAGAPADGERIAAAAASAAAVAAAAPLAGKRMTALGLGGGHRGFVHPGGMASWSPTRLLGFKA